MKKLFLIFYLLIPIGIFAQTNTQILSDGDMYLLSNESLDEYGKFTTSYFTDVTLFNSGDVDAYGEIAQYYSVCKYFAITGQFNADNNSFTRDLTYSMLGGFSKVFNFKGVTIGVDLLYRYSNYDTKHTYQTILLWNKDWKYIQLCGNFDFWDGDKYLSEPQLWLKLNKHLYVGTEYRISNIEYPT